jgi:hypothetical protein
LASQEEPHAERQPAVMSSEPLLSSISSEIARKGSEEKAWKRRKRKTMIRDLLSNSRDDEWDGQEEGRPSGERTSAY